ncbi:MULTISPECIES: PLP-dependent aminotransferase family protein [Ramlibacter]|uniref:Aminotransferase class I/II-fold pyridoxal phosphate-dependent enzyme n=1 Tax=Ramlibacter pinisoli TaxID=2682844 RepID=A0A6N8ITF9_9BURK|nr:MULTISPECIES: PLP-dependent aminotransferase family protein [Ramlibacter]MBA2965153.1 PLP-dependent aminotransferase family protein [Ramlibacter sp. CGMCC 1.13660]MVQ30118.1 aminotransferase class I/II-fold pyridoxal phosphate-dependent enzyme [Ramlibacter pinisoli]
MKRYEALAQDLADSIASGTFRPGDRLPSVRETSESRRVSPSTVFQAYYLLEARGLVEARARSGYFVRHAGSRQPEPGTSEPQPREHEVAISELVFQVLSHARDPSLVPLESAFPSPSLFPLPKLGLALGKAARHLAPWKSVEDLSPGSAGLRRQIGLRYLAMGCSVDVQELVVTNGAMEALNLCLEAVTRPGDLVAVESPTFYAALQALERLNLRAVEVATHPRLGVDVHALAAVLEQHPVKACWLMPNFQNPLGSLMSDESKRELVDLLQRHEIPLIEDDVYAELYFGAHKPRPAKFWDRKGLVMHCSSFSKSLAPGYRVGWTAAGRFAPVIAKRKLMTSLATSVPVQEGLADYLGRSGYDRHLRQLRHTLVTQRGNVARSIARHFPTGTRVTHPEGGYFVWVELPELADALELHRLALSQDISVAPGHLFSADRRFSHHLRINYGHPDNERVEGAIQTLGKIARALISR